MCADDLGRRWSDRASGRRRAIDVTVRTFNADCRAHLRCFSAAVILIVAVRATPATSTSAAAAAAARSTVETRRAAQTAAPWGTAVTAIFKQE